MLSATLKPCTIPLSRQLASRSATLLVASAPIPGGSRRMFMTTPYRYNSLTNEAAQATATTPHHKVSAEAPLHASSSSKEEAITQPTPISTVPTMIRGDWVLFHPVYTPEELKAVQVLHKDAKTITDKIAYGLVKLARAGFDFVSGYKHKPVPPAHNLTLQELRTQGYLLDHHAWLNRILFLESIAGVPGMVAATLRHLQSLRLMIMEYDIDSSILTMMILTVACPFVQWIHTLLSESENERMHLMTFMTLRRPTPFFRALVLGAQGVFYNLLFLTYMVSPNACHRFVGYLEEEAVLTYTRCIKDLEEDRIPEWSNEPAPEIAIDYWRLPQDAKLLDVLYAVRSDETTHRFVNHSLADLNTKTDVNPFAFREPDMHVKGNKIGFERSESEKYVQESHELYLQEKKED